MSESTQFVLAATALLLGTAGVYSKTGRAIALVYGVVTISAILSLAWLLGRLMGVAG